MSKDSNNSRKTKKRRVCSNKSLQLVSIRAIVYRNTCAVYLNINVSEQNVQVLQTRSMYTKSRLGDHFMYVCV